MRRIYLLAGLLALLQACTEAGLKKQLPIYGQKKIVEKEENGVLTADTLFHTIGDFRLVNQDSAVITRETLANKIFVADFFFTSCPSICPIMKTQMLRVYEKFKDNSEFSILSHSIDPEYDTVELLKNYAERLGVSSATWHFLTGSKDEIYELGQYSYMVTAAEDSDAPGGYLHDGAFLLVDKEFRIRGVYDGTQAEQVNELIRDIPVLLAEYHKAGAE